jgi:hypothetical protein
MTWQKVLLLIQTNEVAKGVVGYHTKVISDYLQRTELWLLIFNVRNRLDNDF